MFFPGSQNTQIALDSFGIVIADIAFDHADEFLLTGKMPAIIALTFLYPPESFHNLFK